MAEPKPSRGLDTHAHVFSATAATGARYRRRGDPAALPRRGRARDPAQPQGRRGLQRVRQSGGKDLFRRVHALAWHVEVFVESARLPQIAPAFEDTPVAVAFDHFGGPGRGKGAVDAMFAAVKRLAATRDVWVKLCAPFRLEAGDPRELAARSIEAVGPRRLVWGGDWPWTRREDATDYQRPRESLDAWVGADLVPAILWDNAARLYQFT